jgi:Domain of Unknown Function (DUF928)
MKFAHRLLAIVPLTLVLVSSALPGYSLQFPRTSDRGAPQRTAGAGTRSDDPCGVAEADPLLTAIVPNNTLATTYSVDPELSPALFFYVPATVNKRSELKVVDNQGNEVLVTTMDLPNAAGIVQVNLPQTNAVGDPFFAADEQYYWDFSIICNEGNREDDILVSGGIERGEASADFIASLNAEAGDLLAQAELYAQAGAWQETLVLAANLRRQNAQAWEELLTSVGLANVADAPIVAVETVGGAEMPEPTPVVAPEPTTPASGQGRPNLQRLQESARNRR